MKIFASILVAFVAGVLSTLAFARSSVQDPVKLSPQLYKVLLENDHVRVVEWHLAPGGKEPMHAHRPGIVYEFGDGRFKETGPDGKSAIAEGKDGTVFWRDDTVHAIENVGTTEGHALAVELKKVCK